MNKSRVPTAKNLPEDPARLQRLVADAIPQMVWTAEPDGGSSFFNRRIVEYTGLGADELLGWGWRRIVHPEDWAERELRWRQALATAAPYKAEIRLRRHDGAWRWHLDEALPLKDAAGRVVRWFGSSTDIEERKRAAQLLEAQIEARAEALREFSDRYRALVNSIDGIVWEADPRTFRFLFVSDQAERLLGYPLKRWTAEPDFWRAHVHPQDRDRAVEFCAQATAEKRSHELEYRMLAADGRAVWLRDIVTVVVENGRVARLRGVMVDITAHKQVELALRESERRFNVFMDNSPTPAWIKDSRLRYVYTNRAHQRVHGRALDEMIGRDSFDLWPEPVAREFRAGDQAALASEMPIQRIERVPYADGTEGHWLVVKFRMPDAAGAAGVAGIAIDITVRVEAQQHLRESASRVRQLMQQLVEAQEAERGRIVADLHDLVGQNLSALGVLLEVVRGEAPRGLTAQLSDTLADMGRLIDETVRVTRDLMTDLRPPVLDDYGLVPALEWYAQEFAARSGLRIRVEGAPLEPRLTGDAELALFRIAQEALANAAKHSGAAKVRIAVARSDGGVRLVVEDDGRGFADPQGARAERRGGFGLPAMRERAAALGGSLRVEFPGAGTRVVAEVPCADPRHPG
jgi:PAS domain S-box-containing protein